MLNPAKCNVEYNKEQPCPFDKINLSLFIQFGFFGLYFPHNNKP